MRSLFLTYRLGFMAGISKFILLFLIYLLTSCGKESPLGVYSGRIMDWIHEVYEAQVTSQGKIYQLNLILKQTPQGMKAEMNFLHPEMDAVKRSGSWEVGDGERLIRFDDGKNPDEYFLIKRGLRYAFQTKTGLSNDDGSPILMMRNIGLSRKASYPLKIRFLNDQKAVVEGGLLGNSLKGEWIWASDKIVLSVKVQISDDDQSGEGDMENYKYFFQPSENNSNVLELEKIVILRPFLKKDGSKRQSWMSSLRFSEKPLFKQLDG